MMFGKTLQADRHASLAMTVLKGRSPRFARDDEIDRAGLQTAHAN